MELVSLFIEPSAFLPKPYAAQDLADAVAKLLSGGNELHQKEDHEPDDKVGQSRLCI
jgi:hypothetical protein